MRSMTRPMTTLRSWIGLLDLVPDLHLLGLFAREHDVAFAVLGALEQHVDDVAGLRGDLAGLVDELFDRDDAFGLEADVDDDFGRRHFHDGALDDFAFRDVAEAGIVKLQEGGVFLRIDVGRPCGENPMTCQRFQSRHLLVDWLFCGSVCLPCSAGPLSIVLAGISAPAGCRLLSLELR